MLSKWITTILAAAISAYACGVVAQYGTPVDAALPLIAIVLTIVAAVTTPAIQLAVPLLVGGEIAIADERTRLLWFGIVLAIAFAAALFFVRTPRSATVVTIASIVLLRWIPFSSVTLWREILLILIAVAIVLTLRFTPIGIAVAVAVALFTPLVPLRTILFAVIALLACLVWRRASARRFEIAASIAVAVMLMFFAWSGVLARALPLVWRGLPVNAPRAPMRMALAPGESVVVTPPSDASALILSGANISHLRKGTIVGSIDRVPIRVGDVVDWGSLRREQFYRSRKVLPANPAGDLRGYGQTAWIDGAARFPIPRGAKQIVVTADRGLPRDARLQIDAFELVQQ